MNLALRSGYTILSNRNALRNPLSCAVPATGKERRVMSPIQVASSNYLIHRRECFLLPAVAVAAAAAAIRAFYQQIL